MTKTCETKHEDAESKALQDLLMKKKRSQIHTWEEGHGKVVAEGQVKIPCII